MFDDPRQGSGQFYTTSGHFKQKGHRSAPGGEGQQPQVDEDFGREAARRSLSVPI